jgi:hypothetical protein
VKFSLEKFFSAMTHVQSASPLINWLVKAVRLAGGPLNKGKVKVIISYCNLIWSLTSKGGLKFTVLYLKAQNTNLMQALSGQPLPDMTSLSVRFKRTKSGKLPRIIPILHRIRIRNGDQSIIRFWTTLFSIYRVFQFLGNLDLSTITDSPSYNSNIIKGATWFTSLFFDNLKKVTKDKWLTLALKDSKSGLAQLKVDPFLISSSSPVLGKMISTSFLSMLTTFKIWLFNPEWKSYLYNWLELTNNENLLIWFQTWEDDILSLPSIIKTDDSLLGGLSVKAEAAGKLRVFALVDCLTQWLMKPLHDRLFGILSKIPQDGTFDQHAPLQALLGRNLPLYSLDLSAATDRLPIALQKVILTPLLGHSMTQLWADILIGRSYSLPESIEKHTPMKRYKGPLTVYYKTGQPMGALTSWAMLALTHHFVVQFAAYTADASKYLELGWFTEYAVLGDDIVIANKKVADCYYKLMTVDFGVKIGIHKSLISPSGRALEFAKKFFYLTFDCSAIPLKEVFAGVRSISALIELGIKYKGNLSTLLSIAGKGYKAISGLNKQISLMSTRMRAITLSYLHRNITSKPGYSLADFLSSSSVNHVGFLSPENRQAVLDKLKAELVQSVKDLQSKIDIIQDISSSFNFLYQGIMEPEDFLPDDGSVKNPDLYLKDLITKEINMFNDFSSWTLSEEEEHLIHSVAETFFAPMYKSSITTYDEVFSLINALTLSSSLENFDVVLEQLLKLEDELSLISVITKQQERVQARIKPTVSKYIKLWLHVNQSA